MPRFYPTVEIALGATVTGVPSSWSWTDLTMQRFVHDPSGIQIQRGRGDRFSEATPDTCSLTLLNDGGRFVPSNPLSPYYGSLRRGTPLRVLMRPNTNSASDAFGRTASGGWGTADSGGAWTVVGTAGDYAVSTTNGGRMTNATAGVAHYALLSLSIIRVDLKVRVRVNALSTGAAQSVGVICRLTDASNYARAELQMGTSGAITARLVERNSGSDNVRASAATGLTHSTSTWYWIRLQTGFTAARVRVWQDGAAEPSTWLIDGPTGVINFLNSPGTFGCYSRRETGNTNASATTDFDDFSMLDGPRTQFTGFVDAWPVRWNDAGMAQSFAPITAGGQLRRIGRGRAIRSAIYRASTVNYAAGTSAVVGYWPMEDGSAAKSFASAVGGPATVFTGDVRPAAESNLVGSEPLPVFGGTGSVRHRVPQYTATGTWMVRWAMTIPASAITSSAQIMSWTVTGGSPIVRWQLALNAGSPDTVNLSGWNSAGTAVFSGTAANFVDSTSGAELSDGRQLYFEVRGMQNGGNVDGDWLCWYMRDDGTGPDTVGAGGTTAATNANVTMVYHDAATGFGGGGHAIGHVLVSTDVGLGTGSYGVTGNAGDATDTRLSDLCTELGVYGFFGDLIRGTGTTTQQMGPQASGDILQQLQLVEQTEAGILHDGKQGFVELLPREMRYNRAIDMTLDVNQHDVGWPFEPTDDDALLRNDVTVSNVDGSSARSIDTSSIALQGVYTDSTSVNTYLDSDLQLQADWRLNMGLVDGLRVPTIVVNLTKNYVRLADAWCDADIGSRIQVTNVPSGELPPETLDLIIDGYTETITSSTWTAALNVSPSGQWLSGVLDTNRLDCSASVTSGTLTTAATSVPLTITDTCTWTHADGDFSIYIGGEKMTVTAVAAAVGSGSNWTQTLTVTRSTNGIVKTHAAGEAVHVANPVILAL